MNAIPKPGVYHCSCGEDVVVDLVAVRNSSLASYFGEGSLRTLPETVSGTCLGCGKDGRWKTQEDDCLASSPRLETTLDSRRENAIYQILGDARLTGNEIPGLRWLIRKAWLAGVETWWEVEGGWKEEVDKLRTALSSHEEKTKAPVPMLLWCPEPKCRERHIDRGEFATTRWHHTHSCQACGHTWRPAVVHTVGVQFLPGFKDEAP